MDRITKELLAMSPREKEAVVLLMQQLKLDYRNVPGVQALSGMKGWFRARMGNYRILFVVEAKTKKVEIKRVLRRNEGTYKNLV